MLSKNEVKTIQTLSQKKGRKETGMFLAEGVKIVNELLQSFPDQLVRLYATEVFFTEHSIKPDEDRFKQISEAELEKISSLQTPNQVLAIVHQFKADGLLSAPEEWILALDGIRDPGNMGTIIRMADWFGIPSILCSPDCVDVYNSKVVQASMGSLFRVQIQEVDLVTALPRLQLPVIAAALSGNRLNQFAFPSTGVLLIGNEGEGIRPELASLISNRVTIPAYGNAESLNAAIATGILLWELKRSL
jgi:TrmH family RNA methyltransferase